MQKHNYFLHSFEQNQSFNQNYLLVCDMVEGNVAAIFGPNNPKTSGKIMITMNKKMTTRREIMLKMSLIPMKL